jgi:hypothetical protein
VIAKIAITFFIFVVLLFNYTLIDITTILNIWLLSFYIVRGPALAGPSPNILPYPAIA